MKKSVMSALVKKKRQNFLKVRVGHGTCPRVPQSEWSILKIRTECGTLEREEGTDMTVMEMNERKSGADLRRGADNRFFDH